ncbi:AAA family ATPase [Pseudomonas fluorescens]|uniref:AAA family ATPase n=1 Tax=Pseudomonas fluorescens TaxID=294 RepID=UPI0013986490|nr:AAA family ATPase [Pseudomonas fluorescens]QIA03837.1 AAA family ATPase [Pseudomonas fluorescens]
MAKTKTTTPKYKVYFLANEDLIPSTEGDAFIIPNKRRVDEFGYSVSCKLGLKTTDGKVFIFDGLCAVKGQKNVHKFLLNLIGESFRQLPAEEIALPFRCLFVDAKSYSLVRRAIGINRGTDLLKALHDMAISNFPSRDWLEFSSDPVFSLAMLRSSEAFFAYRRGARMLSGLQEESSDSQRPFTVELKGGGPKYKFDFKFEEANFLRGRIAVLIGKNGCGKTSSLAKIARGLIDTHSRLATITNKPDLNQVIVFIHTSSVRDFTPSSKEGAARARVFTFNPGTPRKANSESMAVLLVDVARGHDRNGPLLNHFSRILKDEFPDFELRVPVRTEYDGVRPKVEYVPFETWSSGSEQDILENSGRVDTRFPLEFLDSDGMRRKMSLGQSSFLRFVLTALSNAGPASVLIIDEPENFLHPNLISRFMRTLNRILEGTRSIAIIATHSPFVVREVQSAHVHVMGIDDGESTIKKPLTQTLGASISTISNEVFGDDLPSHLYDELLEQAEFHSHSFEEALERYSLELSVPALMTLRLKMGAKIAQN